MSLAKIAHDYSQHLEKEAGWGWLKNLFGWSAKKSAKGASQVSPAASQWTAGKLNTWAKNNAAPTTRTPVGFNATPEPNTSLTFKNRLANRLQEPTAKWSEYSKGVKASRDAETRMQTFARYGKYPAAFGASAGAPMGGQALYDNYKQNQALKEQRIPYKAPTQNQNRASFGK